MEGGGAGKGPAEMERERREWAAEGSARVERAMADMEEGGEACLGTSPPGSLSEQTSAEAEGGGAEGGVRAVVGGCVGVGLGGGEGALHGWLASCWTGMGWSWSSSLSVPGLSSSSSSSSSPSLGLEGRGEGCAAPGDRAGSVVAVPAVGVVVSSLLLESSAALLQERSTAFPPRNLVDPLVSVGPSFT